MTPSIKSEFEAAFLDYCNHPKKVETGFDRLLWAAKWAMERCAKEAEKFEPDEKQNETTYASRNIRQLAKELS